MFSFWHRGETNLLCHLFNLLMHWKGFVLFLVAIYDYLYIQNRYPPTVENIHDTGLKPTSHGKARYVLPAALLSVAGILTSFGTDDVRSTYICPQLAGKVVPILQIIGVLLDSFVLISIENVLRIARANNAGTSVVVPKVVGSVFLVSRLVIGGPVVLTLESYRLQFNFLVVSSLLSPIQANGHGFWESIKAT